MIRFLAALFVGSVLAFVGLGFVLPTDWEAKRTATFEATPERIAEYVAQLDTWSEWSHLSTHVDEETEVSVSGATLNWGGGDVLGEGVLTDFSTADECATYALSSGAVKSTGKLCWEGLPSDDPEAAPKTRLTWSENGTSDGGPLVRWYGFLSMDATLGARFDGALERLEELAEAKVEEAPESEVPAAGDDDDSSGDDDDSSGDDDDSADSGTDPAGDEPPAQ
ncbi:MAG: hypothetical protein GY898_04045 [Proteobacteria bacterium]|nr:hypothetical protein [Pseudomonadota bacterium]